MPQPLQHPHHGLTRLRKQRVVIAGNKQRNSQINLRLKSVRTKFNREYISPTQLVLRYDSTRYERTIITSTERGLVGPNPFLGVIYHWIGGFASATNFIPFRGIKRWSWEIYWIIQGFAAWIVAPIVLGSHLRPQPLRHPPPGLPHQPQHLYYSFLWGVLWGVGGITFGLAIRYLGIALGYAIALGLCAASEPSFRPSTTASSAPSSTRPPARSSSLGVVVCAHRRSH